MSVLEEKVTRVSRIASQLLGDLNALPDVHISHRVDQRALQLILDAFEEVGVVAIESHEAERTEPTAHA